MRENVGITVIICENLGRQALLVHTTDTPLLLLSDDLNHNQRVEIMKRFFDPEPA